MFTGGRKRELLMLPRPGRVAPESDGRAVVAGGPRTLAAGVADGETCLGHLTNSWFGAFSNPVYPFATSTICTKLHRSPAAKVLVLLYSNRQPDARAILKKHRSYTRS